MIIKDLVANVGATTTAHVVTQIQIKSPGDTARVEVRSYASEAAYITGAGNLDSRTLTVPLVGMAAPLMAPIEEWLVADASSAFLGGTAVPDAGTSLAMAKARKVAYLNASCSAQITNGFTSGALGEARHYPAKKQDQDNMVASVAESLIPGIPEDWVTPFWCAQGDEWSYQAHTAAQIQQAGRDGKASIVVALMKNEGLRQQVDAAATVDEVNAVNW